MEHALQEYDFREGAAPILVLVQSDEGRTVVNSTLTQDGVLAALDGRDAILTTLTPGRRTTPNSFGGVQNYLDLFTIDALDSDDYVIGVSDDPDGDGNHDALYIDGATGDVLSTVFVDAPGKITGEFPGDGTQAEGETEESYVRLTWDTGGRVWDTGVLNEFGVEQSAGVLTSEAEALATELGKSLAELALGATGFDSGTPVFELNVGGGASGSFSGDTERQGAFLPINPAYAVAPSNANATVEVLTNSIDSATPDDVLQTARFSAPVDTLLLRGMEGEAPDAAGFVATGESVRIGLGGEGGVLSRTGAYSAERLAAGESESFSVAAGVVLQSAAKNARAVLDTNDLGGFTFDFLGGAYSEITIRSEGIILLGDSSDNPSQFSNMDWEDPSLVFNGTQTSAPIIAPHWHDELAAFHLGGQVRWEVMGAGTDEERLVVAWEDFSYSELMGASPVSGDGVTFQAVLYADGTIQYNYLDLESMDTSGFLRTPDDPIEFQTMDGVTAGLGGVIQNNPDLGDLNYSFANLPDGDYVVELLFHNVSNSAFGDASPMTVDLEGVSVLDGYNISNDRASVQPASGDEFPVSNLGFTGSIAKRFAATVSDGDGLQLSLAHTGASSLATAQVSAIRVIGFDATPGLAGDYNFNGTVDAADYSVWRDIQGDWVGRGTGADGDGDGVINDADYDVWVANFGSGTPLAGDYNNDGVVDAADYTVWRDGLGTTFTEDDYDTWADHFGAGFANASEIMAAFALAIGDYNADGAVDHHDYNVWTSTFGSTTDLRADGNGDGVVDAADYTVWRDQLGSTLSTPRFQLLTGQPQAMYVVSTTADVVDGDHSFGNLSLREAVQLANGQADAAILLIAGRYTLDRSGVEAGDASFNDLDITTDLTIIGDGAGVTVIDVALGSAPTSDLRIFELSGSGASLQLEKLTLQTDSTPGLGGMVVYAHGGTDLTITESALVNNTSAQGGAAVSASGANVTLQRSVFTNNEVTNGAGAAIAMTSGSLTISDSVFALNTASFPFGSLPPNVVAGPLVTKTNNGNNLYDNAAGGFFDTTPGAGDHLGSVDYVVTSVADTFDHSDDAYALSIREAIDLANQSGGASEVWVPAWALTLTRDRQTYGGGSVTDTDVAFGDLDISDSLTIRGVSGLTSVAWKAGVTDKVFDLLGDYNGNGIVDPLPIDPSEDYDWWDSQNGSGSGTPADWEQYAADGDDDGDVDTDDETIWSNHTGNTLDLFGVA